MWLKRLDSLIKLDLREHIATLRVLIKWTLLGGAVGVMAGIASAIFLRTLSWFTDVRMANPWLLFLLPVAGLFIGWIYLRYAGVAARGNNLIIDEIHAEEHPVPLRMAPLILVGTLITHLFGGSAGREGTAVQMSASLADALYRLLPLSKEDRRLMLMAGISGGFGSVFGTPIAGFVFGLEVQSVGRMRYEGVVPCLSAAIVGDLVARLCGATHSVYPVLGHLDLDPLLLFKILMAGIAFGATAFLFIELLHGLKHIAKDLIKAPLLRPVVGGVVIIGLTLLLGTQDYLGLSLPLIKQAVNGAEIVPSAFLLKLIFTAITLAAGFVGGEVTPLFCIGATLGSVLGRLVGVDPAFMAAMGFVAVFAAASNTPLACVIVGVELFGGGSIVYIAVACFMAYLASGHRSIYMSQRLGTSKSFGGATTSIPTPQDEGLRPTSPLSAYSDGRRGWISELTNRPKSVQHDTTNQNHPKA